MPDESTAIRFTADLSVLLGERVLHFPARDYVLLDVDGASGEFEHQRLGVLSELLQGTARVVVASAESACERTIPKETLKDSILTIDMDGSYDQEQVVKKLVAMGYQCRDQVEGICQFARRGGILDIFPPDRSEPVRIEFWDDEIDTMSTFPGGYPASSGQHRAGHHPSCKGGALPKSAKACRSVASADGSPRRVRRVCRSRNICSGTSSGWKAG